MVIDISRRFIAPERRELYVAVALHAIFGRNNNGRAPEKLVKQFGITASASAEGSNEWRRISAERDKQFLLSAK